MFSQSRSIHHCFLNRDRGVLPAVYDKLVEAIWMMYTLPCLYMFSSLLLYVLFTQSFVCQHSCPSVFSFWHSSHSVQSFLRCPFSNLVLSALSFQTSCPFCILVLSASSFQHYCPFCPPPSLWCVRYITISRSAHWLFCALMKKAAYTCNCPNVPYVSLMHLTSETKNYYHDSTTWSHRII